MRVRTMRDVFFGALAASVFAITGALSAAAGELPQLVSKAEARGWLDVYNMIVCGDAQDSSRGLRAAIAVAGHASGWQRYMTDGTCSTDFGHMYVIVTGKAVELTDGSRSLIAEAVVVDVLGYIIIPADDAKIADLGRPSRGALSVMRPA